MKRIIDDLITNLSKCEIFVFGSNLYGKHHRGAARMAHRNFGAQWGVGVGPTGQCYAIPTMHGDIEDIKPYVDDFIEYARLHPNNRFLVTRVGCGIAGFKDKDMAALFKEARHLPNVNFPIEWITTIYEDDCLDAYITGCEPEKKVCPSPAAITEEDLIRLCDEYRYVIGSGVIVPLPKIRIRYVRDRDRFGYAAFGNFFMTPDRELYVWTRDKEFKDLHNQDLVEEIFGDECRERGKYFHRAIFAGVETPLKDIYGNSLYTGDVIRVWLKGDNQSYSKEYKKDNSMLLALGTLGNNEGENTAYYACPLDNHCVVPEMCSRIERYGSVFYMLDWNERPTTIMQRCLSFQGISSKKLKQEDKEVLARYTPNFDKKLWKYHANKSLGIEFNTKY